VRPGVCGLTAEASLTAEIIGCVQAITFPLQVKP
jgi:hypothetical protein